MKCLKNTLAILLSVACLFSLLAFPAMAAQERAQQYRDLTLDYSISCWGGTIKGEYDAVPSATSYSGVNASTRLTIAATAEKWGRSFTYLMVMDGTEYLADSHQYYPSSSQNDAGYTYGNKCGGSVYSGNVMVTGQNYASRILHVGYARDAYGQHIDYSLTVNHKSES